ncbi:class I SAM-dependent methyltransferase [Tropicimonas sediminicola]|uniref:Methyltransferase domain-containing protein n=1 Tax=Tropicimonas sediminicola TaxID=1031541 RepID=A0A239GPD5_9RHOB|nr:class I SAM-dependent methyltransferase [Tropicimonas sediminicola]SNS70672.1 Methyltransferase domain-containing protein [Tropicimonas sediminicola]
MPRPSPDDILPTYDRVGPDWAAERSQALFEAGWLRRFLDVAPGPRVLDLGCGSGRPIALWLATHGAEVTGVDGAAAMCRLFARALPDRPVHHCDMRTLALGEHFDAILAWNSFFHLPPEDQRGMFRTFAAHAVPGAALMFTSGPEAGVRYGAVAGAPVYHASLDPREFRAEMAAQGYEVLAYAPEDPDCAGHTIWLARYAPTAA